MQTFEVKEGLLDYYQKEYKDYQNVEISDVRRITENWETIVYIYTLKFVRDNRPLEKPMIIRFYPGREGKSKATKEFNLIASLMLTTVQVPDPYRLELDNIFDLPFMIMEYIKGKLLSERIMEDQNNIEKYLTDFARTMVDIHNVDYETMLHQADNYKVAKSTYHYLAKLLTDYKEKIENHNKLEFVPLLRWLVERMDKVPLDRLSLMHGDYHLANVMIDEQKEMYVIDWVNAEIGDFRVDLAWTLIVHETNLNKPIRDLILNTYRSYAPYEVDEIKYFEVLAILRQLMDLSLNFTFSSEIAKLNPGAVDQMRDNLEPIKRSLSILYGHTGIKLKEFERML